MSMPTGSMFPVESSPRFDQFVFIFQLTCRLTNRQQISYTAQFMENDTFGHGQWITNPYQGTFNPGTVERKFLGGMNGDEFLSAGYSVTAIFHHDCTKSGELVEFQIQFAQLCPLRHTCNMNYHVDLTDQQGHIFVNAKVF